MKLPMVSSFPATLRLPEPVARQIVMVCNSIGRLIEAIDKLDTVITEENKERPIGPSLRDV